MNPELQGCPADVGLFLFLSWAMRPHREVTSVSAVRAKNLTYLAIDVGCILRGVFDQANPLRAVGSLVKLAEKVGGLHDGFNRIAQIMRQAAEPTDDFGRELLRVDHDLFPMPAICDDCTCFAGILR